MTIEHADRGPLYRYSIRLTISYKDRVTADFDKVCLSPIWQEGVIGNQVESIAYQLRTLFSKEHTDLYLTHLQQWGFLVPENGVLVAHNSTVNLSRWASAITALRYLYEDPAIIKWYLEKVYQNPELSPWGLFTVAHHKPGSTNSGHALMTTRIDRAIDPVAANNSLSKVTGFNSHWSIQSNWFVYAYLSSNIPVDWKIVYDHFMRTDEAKIPTT